MARDSPFNWLIPKRKYTDGIKLIERFMDPYIQATLRLSPDELDKLSKSDKEFTFLHNIALLSRDPKLIRDQIMAVLLAGRDTTASTLAWCVYELANRPDVWARLRAQVLETVGPHRAPTYEHLKNLTLLSHTLNETLRLWPAVPYNLRSCRAFPSSCLDPACRKASALTVPRQSNRRPSKASPASPTSPPSQATSSSTARSPCSAAATSTRPSRKSLPTRPSSAPSAGSTGLPSTGTTCLSTVGLAYALARTLPSRRWPLHVSWSPGPLEMDGGGIKEHNLD